MQRPAILSRLGSLSVQQFMRTYWQRKPLLIRQAWPDFRAPIDRARLFELARQPDVESRLIAQVDGRWTLQQGPLHRLPSVRRGHWTVLVQGADLHDDSARQLLSRFRFVPDARLDDLMISYAADGGGVGPHVDSYDVFLLQGEGRRRWRISGQRKLRSQSGAAIRVVSGFRATRQWTLDAGDMLYLPPGVPHEGVAIGECMTYSIGFRAPAYRQLLDPWFADFAERADPQGRYGDAGAAATARAAVLPPAMIRQIHRQLAQHRPGVADTEQFLLRYLTEPKATTLFETPPRALGPAQFQRRASRRGVALDRRSRMLYSNGAVAINGDWLEPPPKAIASLRALADQRALYATHTVSAEAWKLLHDWYRAGWVGIAD